MALSSLVFGVLIGWFAKPVEKESLALPRAKSSHSSKRVSEDSRSRRGEAESLAAQLMEDSSRQLVDEMDEDLLQAVLEELIPQFWGTLSQSEAGRIQALVSKWCEVDFEGCLQWGRSLGNERQKQAVMIAIAVDRQDEDIKRAFEIYAELGVIEGGFDSAFQTSSLGRDVLRTFAKEGAESLLETMRAMHGRKDGGGGWDLEYPADFDFAKFFNGWAALEQDEGVNEVLGDASRSYSPAFSFVSWAARDFHSAVDYAFSSEGPQGETRWFDLITDYHSGRLGMEASEARSLMGERLNELPLSEFRKVIEDANVGSSTRIGASEELLKYLSDERALIFEEQLSKN